ncbi:MAG: tRNA (N6-threonylcarbamoyladenosine(37)-N6)-methyltransferase TrmO [Anaerolineae bacterium]|nr:tRNA (N6-threonylcarbamoyladenosine(37)-N6)-methyltransferase TrmO [Anaerolineae bacterium]
MEPLLPITYRPIGVLHTPFQEPVGMPIQAACAVGTRGTAELSPEFKEALQDLEGFSHLILLYHLHRAAPPRLRVTPFLDTELRGVFATRAPARPNPLGLSVVRLLERAGCVLYLENLDMLDGTPLLDIKPYIPDFDSCTVERLGWYERRRGLLPLSSADDRFSR